MLQKSIIIASAALILAGCGETTTTATETAADTVAVAPQAPEAPTPVEYTAIYNVPLTKVAPEDFPADLIRPEFVEKNNLGQLKPAIEKMLKDALAGKLKAYPESGSDAENNPDTYFTRTVKDLGSRGMKADVASLSKNISMELKCMDMGDFSNLSPDYLIVTWTDPKDQAPEMKVAKIAVADLAAYSMEIEGQPITLQNMVINGNFEKYVSMIQGPTETIQLTNINDAASLQEKINKGDIH